MRVLKTELTDILLSERDIATLESEGKASGKYVVLVKEGAYMHLGKDEHFLVTAIAPFIGPLNPSQKEARRMFRQFVQSIEDNCGYVTISPEALSDVKAGKIAKPGDEWKSLYQVRRDADAMSA